MAAAHALVKGNGKEDRRIELPDGGKWPIFVGSSPDCTVVLDAPGVAPRQARLDWMSNHVFLTVLEGDSISANDEPLAKGGEARVDEAPFQVGPFVVQIIY